MKDAELKMTLKQLSQKLNNLKSPLNHTGYHLLEIVSNSFENEASPDGTNWANLSPKYLDYKRRIGKEKKLQISRHLENSIDFEATTDYMILGTNLIYAPIHQFGGKTGRGHKATIPSRPFLPITKDADIYEDIVKDIVEIFKDYLI